MDSQKDKIMSANEEASKRKQEMTCEHGKLLMTINNLYVKVSKFENWQIVSSIRNEKGPQYEKNDFDEQANNEELVKRQLDEIERFCNNYERLRFKFKDVQTEKQARKKEEAKRNAEKKIVDKLD